jgi:hypothetical protein
MNLSLPQETESPRMQDGPDTGNGSGGESAIVRQTELTDEAREEAIKRAGEAVERHMAKRAVALLEFDITNNFADKGDADRHRLMAEEAARLMADLIRGRSPEYVAKIERERGLA